jgi:hypothetical protein
MTDLIEVQTSQLTGEALAWSVAKAEGLTVFIADPQYGNPYRVMVHFKRDGKYLPQQERFKPQTDWSQGGPLIEKFGVSLDCIAPLNSWEAFVWGGPLACDGFHDEAETPLIAACRAIVAAKLGDTVQVPKELMS